MKNKTYVYNNTEVRLTGRVAKKPLPTTRKYGRSEAETELFEIEPFDPTERNWKKWVSMSDLYEITNIE